MPGNLSIRELRQSASVTANASFRSGSFLASKRNNQNPDTSISYQQGDDESFLGNQSTTFHSGILGANVGSSHDSGAVELTKNAMFRVSRLAATPAVLQNEPTTTITSGSFDQISNQALLLSNQMAYIWNYKSPDSTPTSLSFPISNNPDGESNASFGIFISPVAGTVEPGLLTVTREGILNYWESTGGVLSEGMLQKRQTLNHQIQLYTAEVIETLSNHEPAGIIATTSSGRYILISLRDSAGKSNITSSTMRGTGSGFWSNLRGALSVSTSRRNVIAVKSGVSNNRSHRQVFIVNQEASLTIWDCNRALEATLTADLQLKQLMLGSIKDIYPQAESTFITHDLQILNNGFFVLLTSFKLNDQETSYILFTFDLINGNPHIVSTYRIQSYSEQYTQRPKTLLPQPGDTLFVVFESAVVLVDTVKKAVTLNPRSLLERKWEDIVTFKPEVRILTSGCEDLVQANGKVTVHAGIVLSTTTAGLIRFERFESALGVKMTEYQASEYDLAKTRVEQAIHFGGDEENPIVFDLRHELAIHPQEIEAALLAVSEDILRTSSPYLPPHLPSIVEHLDLRCERLERLAYYVNHNLSNAMSVKTRLQLLWHLEMGVAARNLWSLVDPTSIDSIEAPQSVLLTIIAQHVHDQNIRDPDPLRAWFLSHLDDFMNLLLDAQKFAQHRSSSSSSSSSQLVPEILWDTNRVLLTVLNDSAYKTRDAYASDIYGLDESDVYEISPWTSSRELIYALEDQYALTRDAVTQLATTHTLYDKLKHQMLDLVAVLYQAYDERIKWNKGQTTDQDGNHQKSHQREIASLESRLAIEGHNWLMSFVPVGERERALNVAEHYRVFTTMVQILDEHYKQIIQSQNITLADKDAHLFQIRQTFLGYFEAFGYPFAAQVYQYFNATKQYKSLLTQFPQFNPYLEQFFQAGHLPEVAWVHDVQMGEDRLAGEKLIRLTLDRPGKVQTKQVQLSIAKLALLSNISSSNSAATANETNDLLLVDEVDRQLDLTNAQRALYDQIRGHMPHRPDGTVDIFSDEFAAEFKTRDMSFLQVWFKHVLDKLALEVALTIDELVEILTLINLKTHHSVTNFLDALRLVAEMPEKSNSSHQPGSSNNNKDFLARLIWRRALLCDNWNQILTTKGKSDDQMTEITSHTTFFQLVVAGLKEGLFDNNDNNLALPGFESSLMVDADKSLLMAHFTQKNQNQTTTTPTETELNGLFKDLMAENELLIKSGDKVGLEGWIQGLVVAAKRVVGQEPTFGKYSTIRTKQSSGGEPENDDDDDDVVMIDA